MSKTKIAFLFCVLWQVQDGLVQSFLEFRLTLQLMAGLTTGSTPRLTEMKGPLAPETVHAVKTFMKYLDEENLSGIVRVILYGSRARGNFTIESDTDLAVIFSGQAQNDNKRFALEKPICKARTSATLETKTAVSAIVLWEEELLEPEKQQNPAFFHNINHDGIDASNIL